MILPNKFENEKHFLLKPQHSSMIFRVCTVFLQILNLFLLKMNCFYIFRLF
jgi:hypothetical protein